MKNEKTKNEKNINKLSPEECISWLNQVGPERDRQFYQKHRHCDGYQRINIFQLVSQQPDLKNILDRKDWSYLGIIYLLDQLKIKQRVKIQNPDKPLVVSVNDVNSGSINQIVDTIRKAQRSKTGLTVLNLRSKKPILIWLLESAGQAGFLSYHQGSRDIERFVPFNGGDTNTNTKSNIDKLLTSLLDEAGVKYHHYYQPGHYCPCDDELACHLWHLWFFYWRAQQPMTSFREADYQTALMAIQSGKENPSSFLDGYLDFISFHEKNH